MSTLTAPPATARFAPARSAITAIFFVNGFVFASWTPRIPQLQDALDLSEGILGTALLALSAGAVIAMQVTGRLVSRYGSRRVTLAAGLGFCVSLPSIAAVWNLPSLFVALALFGCGNGAMDVAMNAHGIAVQREWGKPILSSMHAMFSLGAFGGAAFGGWAVHQRLPIGTQFALVAAAGIAALLGTRRHLLPAEIDRTQSAPPVEISTDSTPPGAGSARSVPARVLLLGLLGFCCLGEGAVADWSAVYLDDHLGTSAGFAASGFAVFAVTMTIGRFSGDWLTRRFGPARLARALSALGAGGFAAALTLHNPWAALVGFALLGLGLACLIPLIFSAAGQIPEVEPGRALAVVATFSYGGSLLGPVLIGAIASLVGLPTALALPAVLLGLVTVFAAAVRPAPPDGC
jgi:fucose permease